ncbi:hypothetical protein DYI37_07800 [Fulvimarina endophytica]|uniref:Surface antigen domain-containing protein n=1 Tax=Fulvimarina endophytica TaxID=2293836 RepID=A0A371X4S6_9HYPH|nr:hypothetical protein [Fulvimarina endophytica]RFC64235.1 hypothetical protein DYI37_07800 [Fulvimarina endophytica]
MPRKPFTVSLLACLALSLNGCLSLPGAGLAPSSPGAASLDGGIIGRSAYAQRLPSGARARAVEAEYQALQFGSTGEPVAWSAEGVSGRVVPTQVYRVGSQDCRSFTQYVDGAGANGMIGTACKSPEGTWVLV